MFKPFIIILVALFLLLQYELWFSHGGIKSIMHMNDSIAVQQAQNHKAADRNKALVSDIRDLKSGNEAIEERARNNLGLVKKGETFYQVVVPQKHAEADS
jgi:cell division protein FtsB